MDLLAVLFQNGSLSDVAKTWERVGRERTKFLSLGALMLQCLNPRDRRHTWVWTEGLNFRGLASVRNRCLSCAWEVDHLVLNEDDSVCCSSLLEKLSITGGENEVDRVFLRLPADSPLVATADEAGFSHYAAEHLYVWERTGQEAATPGSTIVPFPRRKRADDDYRVFELYEKCVPASVRRYRGMTLGEWQANRERAVGAEWVFEEGDALVGWLAVKSSRHAGQLDVMAHSPEATRQIVDCGLMFLGGCQRVFCLAPEFGGGLCRLLEERGFSQMGKYSALAKEPMAKEKQPCLALANA
jgi:hypothetical protein